MASGWQPRQIISRVDQHDLTARAVPTNPIATLLSVPKAIERVATSFVGAMLTPFLAPCSQRPVETPILWAVYWWVRVKVPKNWQRDPNSLAGLGFQGPAKSPTAVILLPSQAIAKPPAVKAQFKMIARCEGLFIHASSAAVGVAADPVPQ